MFFALMIRPQRAYSALIASATSCELLPTGSDARSRMRFCISGSWLMSANSDFRRARMSVRCRIFRTTFDGGLETAALYERAGTHSDSRAPVVLVQHGGSTSKTGPDVWDLGPALVAEHGLRIIALDGPVHGARRGLRRSLPRLSGSLRGRQMLKLSYVAG